VAAKSTAPRVPVEERLFSLVLALLATDTGLTKAEILSTVQGYRQRYDAHGDNGNLERQFERDKDDIRDLGVPLETIESPGDAGNNQNLRYRIVKGEYDLPDDIRFTPEETTLLDLAAVVWREGSLSSQSQRAILKLRALGVTTAEPVLGYTPRLRARDSAFEPLNTAIDREQIVRLRYLKPGETDARERELAPLSLVQHHGRWHLFALEPDTGATKTFLLSRIVSEVKPTSRRFTAPEGDPSEQARAGLERLWAENTAVVEVEPGSDAAARLSNRRGTEALGEGRLRLHFTDRNVLADELTAFGPEVLVIEPTELVEAVVARLERTASDHG